jgi:hypothetical protein
MQKLIYIGGYGRSGSTVLEIFLNNQPSFYSIGEAINLYVNRGLVRCSCGMHIEECDFWSQRTVLENSNPYLDDLKFVSSLIGDKSSYIVDSSKTTFKSLKRLNYLIAHCDVTFIYIAKRPEQVFNSLVKGSNKNLELDRHANRTLFLMRSVIGYFFAMRNAYCIAKRTTSNSLILLLDDFVDNPNMVLDFIGVHRSSQVVLDSYKTQNGHSIAGNRLKSVKRDIKLSIKDSANIDIGRLGLYRRGIYFAISQIYKRYFLPLYNFHPK